MVDDTLNQKLLYSIGHDPSSWGNIYRGDKKIFRAENICEDLMALVSDANRGVYQSEILDNKNCFACRDGRLGRHICPVDATKREISQVDIVKAVCHTVSGQCAMVDEPGQPVCTIDNCVAIRAASEIKDNKIVSKMIPLDGKKEFDTAMKLRPLLQKHIDYRWRDMSVMAIEVLREATALYLEAIKPTNIKFVNLAVIREALEAAPVHVTKDGTWINFRPDAHKRKGGAMIKIEGNESEAIRTFGKKVEAALAVLNSIENEA